MLPSLLFGSLVRWRILVSDFAPNVAAQLRLTRYHRSWKRGRITSLGMASESRHGLWSDCVGNFVPVLYPVQRGDEGARAQPRDTPLEVALTTIRRMGGLHRLDSHCPHLGLLCFSKGTMECVNICGFLYQHSDLCCASHRMEAILSNKGWC